MSIIDRFRPRVMVTVSPDVFVYDCGDAHVVLEPMLRVDDAGRLLAVGADAVASDRGRLLDLFRFAHHRGEDWQQATAFRAFCRYGIAKAMEHVSVPLKPHVVITGAASLENVFDGEQEEILRTGFTTAGAARVAFAKGESG